MSMNLDNIRVITHSAVRIALPQGGALYFDPFDLTDADAVHDARYLFITHPHYDHLSPKDAERVMNEKTEVIAPATIAGEVAALGAAKTHLLAPGDELELDGATVLAVPSYNTDPARLEKHPQERNWLGYVVTIDGVRYYIAGDTDENEDVDKVSCDVAIIPIGGTYTMDPHQAATFVNAIRPQAAIPTHYGNIVGSFGDAEVFASEVDPSIKVVTKMER